MHEDAERGRRYSLERERIKLDMQQVRVDAMALEERIEKIWDQVWSFKRE